MNTTIEKNLAHKLNKIRFEANEVKEAMETLIERIDKKGIEVGLGLELKTELQTLITQFLTMREIYQELEQQ